MSRRLIHTVNFLNNTYGSAKSAVVKGYVAHALKEHCAKTPGLDDKGADVADVPGPAKAGGWFATEPFHLTFLPKKDTGDAVTTTNPNANNKVTVRHHFYIANSKADLEAKAAAWDAAQKAAAAKK